MSSVTPHVQLLEHTPDPLAALYVAYRGCYSKSDAAELTAQIESGAISRDTVVAFVSQRLQEGHVSPLYQLTFRFSIAGVSRAFSHQFVRHHAGVEVEQVSQRYVDYSKGFDYVLPESVRTNIDPGVRWGFERMMAELASQYAYFVSRGVPPEDARFILPAAAATSLLVRTNLAALLHIADQRLCLRTQWEFRRVVVLMRKAVIAVAPELGRLMAPKCAANRLGYCDESLAAYRACPLSAGRPHKSSVIPGIREGVE